MFQPFMGSALILAALAGAAASTAAAAGSAAPAAHLAAQIAVPGAARWDYVHVDPIAHRLYVAHGDRVDIIDTRRDQLVGQLTGTPGVHGVAVAPSLGLIFTSNGADGEIGVFNAADSQRVRSIKAGANPDAIVYEPLSQRVIAFNGRSKDLTIADAVTGQIITAALPVGGKPEFAVVGPKGLVYFNIEDTAEIAVLDVAAARLIKRYSIAPCEDPTGLDRDERGRLYAVCRNRVMVISDPATGRVLGSSPIGQGADGVVVVAPKAGVAANAISAITAISANGRDGTISFVTERAGGFETLTTLPTAASARTVAVDPGLRKLYLPAADFQPAPAPASGPAGRPSAVPDSFRVLVMQLDD